MACALTVLNRVCLTAITDRTRPQTYARAGVKLLTVIDRIRGRSTKYGLNGSTRAITALKGRPEQGVCGTREHCHKG